MLCESADATIFPNPTMEHITTSGILYQILCIIRTQFRHRSHRYPSSPSRYRRHSAQFGLLHHSRPMDTNFGQSRHTSKCVEKMLVSRRPKLPHILVETLHLPLGQYPSLQVRLARDQLQPPYGVFATQRAMHRCTSNSPP